MVELELNVVPCTIKLPETVKLFVPEIVTAPVIVPPEELNFVFELSYAACAITAVVFANPYPEPAYVKTVFALANPASAVVLATFALAKPASAVVLATFAFA